MYKGRYNIGLVAGNLVDDYPRDICKGALKGAKLADCNLFIFPVKYFDCEEAAFINKEMRYEYQYNDLIRYADSKSLDAVMICLGNICYKSTPERRREIIDSFKNTPVVLISSDEEGYSNIKYDSVTGMRQGIEYMIKQKGCKRIGMVTAYNQEAVERTEIFRQTLRDNGIEVLEKRIIADKSCSSLCENSVEILISENPDLDGIVCVNDSVAMGVYNVLKRHNYKIGEDIFVLGFDNIREASHLVPPLASVAADVSKLGERAVLEVADMLDKHTIKTPRVVKMDTQFVPRQSVTGRFEEDKKTLIEISNDYRKKLDLVIELNHTMNSIYRELLMTDDGGGAEDYRSVLKAYNIANMNDYYLFLFKDPSRHIIREYWDMPPEIYLRAYRNGETVQEPPRTEQCMSLGDLFDNRFMTGERKSYVVVDVYSREMQFGVLMCDIPKEYYSHYEMFTFQIGIAVKMRYLFQIQHRLMEEKDAIVQRLRIENHMLDDVSSKDELTGILNRHGLIRNLEAMIKDSNNIDKECIFMYSDLNYLKLINDNFGHEEGDFALKSVANALEAALDGKGYVGRIGGDEFVACAFAEGRDEDYYSDAVKSYLLRLNERSGKPYNVCTSIGALKFTISENTSIENLLVTSDDRLYEDKHRKPPFVVREVPKTG
jgi:diguanylate cyclase (GGDEF)-like protein